MDYTPFAIKIFRLVNFLLSFFGDLNNVLFLGKCIFLVLSVYVLIFFRQFLRASRVFRILFSILCEFFKTFFPIFQTFFSILCKLSNIFSTFFLNLNPYISLLALFSTNTKIKTQTYTLGGVHSQLIKAPQKLNTTCAHDFHCFFGCSSPHPFLYNSNY